MPSRSLWRHYNAFAHGWQTRGATSMRFTHKNMMNSLVQIVQRVLLVNGQFSVQPAHQNSKFLVLLSLYYWTKIYKMGWNLCKFDTEIIHHAIRIRQSLISLKMKILLINSGIIFFKWHARSSGRMLLSAEKYVFHYSIMISKHYNFPLTLTVHYGAVETQYSGLLNEFLHQ